MTENPAALVEQVFGDIARTRMAGLPIVNPALRVQAVEFRLWQGCWAGVLLTPWSLSLLLLAGPDAVPPKLGPDRRQTWDFPSGRYEFMGLDEPTLGTCQICPLLSPLPDYTSHESALAVAQQVALAWFKTGTQEPSLANAEQARLQGQSVLQQPISRRAFLRGSLWSQ